MITDPSHRHDTIAALALAALTGLAVAGAGISPALSLTGHPVLVVVGLVLVAVLVGLGRWIARRVRERHEDAADLIAGAAWRAEHMPHVAPWLDHQAGDERDRVRAGVAR